MNEIVLDIAPGGFVAEIADERGHKVRRALVGGDFGPQDGRRKLGAVGSKMGPRPRISRMIKGVVLNRCAVVL